MKTGTTLLILASISALYGLFCMVQMLRYLSSKGEKVLLRLKWYNYMFRYRELTVAENGCAGRHHRGYVVSMIAALVLTIAGALLLDH